MSGYQSHADLPKTDLPLEQLAELRQKMVVLAETVQLVAVTLQRLREDVAVTIARVDQMERAMRDRPVGQRSSLDEELKAPI